MTFKHENSKKNLRRNIKLVCVTVTFLKKIVVNKKRKMSPKHFSEKVEIEMPIILLDAMFISVFIKSIK